MHRVRPTYPLIIRSLGHHSTLARDLRKYTKAHYSQRRHARNASVPTYWRVLPAFLAKKLLRDRHSNHALNRFLRDVILAQRMLYLAIRIQDDLFDGQAGKPSLIFASDNLLIEAEALLSGYFPKESRFWTIYRDCLRETTRSIVELDRLEKSLQTKPKDLLDFHAKVCSIFKIGSAAVCARANTWKHFKSIASYCDEMAKAGQIIDDLMDLNEDLERKRYNYAANISHRTASTTGTPGRNGRDNFEEKIFEEARRHVAKARKAIKPLKIVEADEHVSKYNALLSKIENDFARMRIEAFLEKLIKTQKSPARPAQVAK